MKKILLSIVFALTLSPNFLPADKVSSWCGYNENSVSELRNRYGKEEIRVLASSFNQKDIDEIKEVYKKLDYNETRIWDMYKEDWTKESGPGFNVLNKIIPKKILVDTGIMKAIVGEIVWHEKIDRYGSLFNYQQIINGDGILIFVTNPKLLKFNLQMIKQNIEVTEEMVIKATFNDSYNPCE